MISRVYHFTLLADQHRLSPSFKELTSGEKALETRMYGGTPGGIRTPNLLIRSQILALVAVEFWPGLIVSSRFY
jgi:hypothetical protein